MSKLDQIRALREAAAKAPPAPFPQPKIVLADGRLAIEDTAPIIPAPLKRRAKGTGRDPVKRRAYMRDLMRKRRAAKKEQGT